LSDIITDEVKEKEMTGACGKYGGEEKCVQVLVGKPEGK
jgi:phosphoenolpyruvate-protein kinase (PTS system EI component)